MSITRTFLLEPTGMGRAHLRRYANSDEKCGGGKYSFHNADGERLGDFKEIAGERGIIEGYEGLPKVEQIDRARFPLKCDGCAREFLDSDPRQVFTESLYRRKDTGEIMGLRAAPPGAIWRATWMEDMKGYTGPDGRTYICRLPGNHDWIIDSIASNCPVACTNCGRPYAAHMEDRHRAADAPNPCPKGYVPLDNYAHKCWVRTGDAPYFTVGKDGVTCSAGAGSILVPEWHGFLKNGVLTE